MATWTYAYSNTTPLNTGNIREGDDEIRNAKLATDERISKEHYTLVSGTSDDPDLVTASGRHKPGQCQVVLVDTESNLTGASTYTKGCIGYATDTQVIRICNAGAFDVAVGAQPAFVLGKASEAAVQDIGTSPTEVTWPDAIIDTHSGHSAANEGYDVQVAGKYVIHAALFGEIDSDDMWVVGIYVDDVLTKSARGQRIGSGTQTFTWEVSAVLDLSVGEIITISANHSSTGNKDLQFAAANTYFEGYLISR